MAIVRTFPETALPVKPMAAPNASLICVTVACLTSVGVNRLGNSPDNCFNLIILDVKRGSLMLSSSLVNLARSCRFRPLSTSLTLFPVEALFSRTSLTVANADEQGAAHKCSSLKLRVPPTGPIAA